MELVDADGMKNSRLRLESSRVGFGGGESDD